jgi:hypothetical protein
MWQADITAWQLASGALVEILNLIDDHSRLFLGSDAYERVKAADVVASFHKAAELHGAPASRLSDNGAVFTGSYRSGKMEWTPFDGHVGLDPYSWTRFVRGWAA